MEGGEAIHSSYGRSSQAYELDTMERRSSEQESDESHVGDQDQTRKIVRKLDLILLPFLCALFLLNSLDKSNIGNAETAGFTHDAGLASDDLNTSMAFFFAFFVALQPVGAILGRYVGMSRYVPACMSLWGLCTVLHVFVHTRVQLVLLRVAVAILEAGFYPTTVQYLSLFYTRHEFAFRLGFFYGQSTVAGAVGALLSWLIFSIYPANAGGSATTTTVHSWQLLFIVEGCLTMIVATLGFFWLPTDISSTWFLSSSERRLASSRVLVDRAIHQDKPQSSEESIDDVARHESEELFHDDRERLLHQRASSDGVYEHQSRSKESQATITWADIRSAFLQYRIWHLLVCNILSAIPATAFAVFLPVVIRDLMSSSNSSPTISNLLAAPPFICGTLTVLMFTKWSDHTHQRLFPIICGLLILCSGLSLAVILPKGQLVLRYLSICIVLSGSFIASPLTVAWISDNTPEPAKRAVLLGINGWGNLAGVSSAVLFTAEDAGSGYSKSFAVTLTCAIVSLCGYVVFGWMLSIENRRRGVVTSQWTSMVQQREASHGDSRLSSDYDRGWLTKLLHRPGQHSRMGDDKLTYRFTY